MAADVSTEIARIDAVIADAERYIERQRQLMANLSAAGGATEEAELALDVMVGTLAYLRHLRLNVHMLLPGSVTNQ